MQETMASILAGREERAARQRELLTKFPEGTLLTVRVNWPGPRKDGFLGQQMGKRMVQELEAYYGAFIGYQEEYLGPEGYIGHMVWRAEGRWVKEEMIRWENSHPLGRCVDLDVYQLEYHQKLGHLESRGISRSQLGYPPRTCFLCHQPAKLCGRSQTHPLDQLEGYLEACWQRDQKAQEKREEMARTLSQLALKAIIKEAATMPSFGLVSPLTCGSHEDMDFELFIESAFVLEPYLQRMAWLGYSHQGGDVLFQAIRRVGQEGERAMWSCTHGVNTHKGMLFVLGVVVTGAARVLFQKGRWSDLPGEIQQICGRILEDFSHLEGKTSLSHGERLYQMWGLTGVRGEVAQGLSTLFHRQLPQYLQCSLPGQLRYAQTLLELMACVEDTTLVHRGGLEGLQDIQRMAQEVLDQGGMAREEGRKAAQKLEEICIQRRLSPGGSADLLAVVIFLGELYEGWFS